MRREEGREMATLQLQDLLVISLPESHLGRPQSGLEDFGRLAALWTAARRCLSEAKTWKNTAGPCSTRWFRGREH